MAWTSPRTWIAGEVLSAALLNTHLRDNLSMLSTLMAARTTFAPSLAQSASLTTSTLTAEYTQVNKEVIGQVFAVFSSAGSAAAQVTANLPVSPRRNSSPFTVGKFTFYDVSATTYYSGSVAFLASGSTVRFITNAAVDTFGIAPGVTVASGDILAFEFSYEAA